MAQSRLEKIGTIFSRVTLLVKGGAMKPDDKPLWYDIYKAFPPKLEPRFDRPAPNIAIKDIFYQEDIIRAQEKKEGVEKVEKIGESNRKLINMELFSDKD
ncbi:28S ribosomal protein S23, mitochondrial-like isoform X1 [Aphidius gifuensis]|nr:28S ribosomal protein S23, mitochondrial-like isoform X1 [Aphidius gifuensis]